MIQELCSGLKSLRSESKILKALFLLNFSIINITAARINNQAFFARKPTASPAVLKTKLAIALIIPGKISPIFFPMFFNAPPTPFPRLVSPFLRLFTITPITKPTADTTANTVKPYFLKISLNSISETHSLLNMFIFGFKS